MLDGHLLRVMRVLPRRAIVRAMISGLLIFGVMFLVFTFPATWLLMLFFGNLGMGLSYWAVLPLGALVSVLLGTAGTQWDVRS